MSPQEIGLTKVSPEHFRFERSDGLIATAHKVWVITVDPEDLTDPLDDGCLLRDWTTTTNPNDAIALASRMMARVPEQQRAVECDGCEV